MSQLVVKCYILVCLYPIIIKSQTINASISNSSVDYYISHENSDLSYSVINCNSNKICHIKCSHPNSCNNINIYCKNADLCILDCDGSSSCQGLDIYIGSNDNLINCNGDLTCYPFLNSKLEAKWPAIHTDYRNYPLSNVVLTCSNQAACDYLDIFDNSGGTGYLYSSQFKIVCEHPFGGCEPSIKSPYPLAIPNIVNDTGEYYFDIASFLQIKCSHSLLCSVVCSVGACKKTTVDCGNSDECIVTCHASDDETICTNMDVTAHNNVQFNFTCAAGTIACDSTNIHIDNVKAVSILCSGPGNCNKVQFDAYSVENISIECGGSSCHQMKWDIENVYTISGTCNDSCNGVDFKLNHTENFDFICHSKCWGLNILPIQNNHVLNLNCCGENSCSGVSFCDHETNDCHCKTGSPTTWSPTVFPSRLPSISPTVSPLTNSPTLSPNTSIDGTIIVDSMETTAFMPSQNITLMTTIAMQQSQDNSSSSGITMVMAILGVVLVAVIIICLVYRKKIGVGLHSEGKIEFQQINDNIDTLPSDKV